MPPVVTGAIVALIGLNLAPVAWDGGGGGGGVKAQPVIAVVTLAAILLATVAFRGFLGRLSILLGVAVGWLVAAPPAPGPEATRALADAAWVGLPDFHAPTLHLAAALLVAPVVLVLIAENAGHVKAVAAMTGRDLDREMGRAFLGDGLATMLAGSGGGSGTTTYAENIGVMAATRVYSTAAYWVAGAAAILLGLSPKFGALILTVPGRGARRRDDRALRNDRGARRPDLDREPGRLPQPDEPHDRRHGADHRRGELHADRRGSAFNGIAIGTAAAIVVYHLMRWIARLRGTA